MGKYTEKVLRCQIKKEFGYLYFIDKDGDVARCETIPHRMKRLGHR